MIETDISNAWGGFDFSGLMAMEGRLTEAHNTLTERARSGEAALGWYQLACSTEEKELDAITLAAGKIRRDSRALVVVGQPGICSSIRAAAELLRGACGNEDAQLRLYYAGTNFSAAAVSEIVERVQNTDFSVFMVSGAESKLETALSARTFRWLLNRKYGPEKAKERIYAATDPRRGRLHAMALEEGWTCFTLPAGLPDPCCVLTAAGLLPLSAAGVDVRALMAGARQAEEQLEDRSMENPVWLYAGVRTLLQENHKQVELLSCSNPAAAGLGRWWQQLYAGIPAVKQGLFPAWTSFMEDFESIGQYLCGRESTAFQTLLTFAPDRRNVPIELDWKNVDDLNYLAGKGLALVGQEAEETMLQTLVDGGTAVIQLSCGRPEARTLGQLLAFFQLGAALSGLLQGSTAMGQSEDNSYRKQLELRLRSE